jgi:hypothetical protein
LRPSHRIVSLSLALSTALITVGLAVPRPGSAEESGCTFAPSFQTLHDLLPETVGACLTDEYYDAETGTIEQPTTGGLLAWRGADGLVAFTDGETTWILGPDGLASRLNNAPLLPAEQAAFIRTAAEAARLTEEQTGVPASVTIAQAILESSWGSSRLARENNNYFGIKAKGRLGPASVVWYDVWEVIDGADVVQRQPFRAYHTAAESFIDHGRFFLRNRRYADALAVRDDPRQFAREIDLAGYATDPDYSDKLIALMDRFNLYAYDQPPSDYAADRPPSAP